MLGEGEQLRLPVFSYEDESLNARVIKARELARLGMQELYRENAEFDQRRWALREIASGEIAEIHVQNLADY